jgi:phage protein D
MPATTFSALPLLEIDGAPLAEEVKGQVQEVVVDQSLQLPDMFHIVLMDPRQTVLESARLEVGTRVKIATVPIEGAVGETLITGEVTSIEGIYGPHGAHVVVRGYDHSHRLHRGRLTTAYKNVKDSDIVRTVCRRTGLTVGDIQDSGTVHDHVTQANLSDLDFLKGRAREIGFELTVIDAKLHFTRPVQSAQGPGEGHLGSDDPLQLVLGQNLVEFRPRVTASEQVNQVQVRGWDPTQKRVLVGTASAATESVKLPSDPVGLAQKFGGPGYVAGDRPLATQREVDAAAQAIADQIASAFAEADGVARGNQKLKAGLPISISMVGAPFCGKYTLTHTRHVFAPHHEYLTHFTVSGRQERSLLGLVSMGSTNGSASGGGPPVTGVVIAQVTNNDDPSRLGRVKLRFPWLSDDYESDWARVAHLGAGPSSGAVFLPEVGDEVLVAFEFGEVRRPYVVGGLWNGEDRPTHLDGIFDHGKLKHRGFVSRRGHQVLLYDDPSKSGIALLSSDGKLKVELDETGGQIVISCQGKVKVSSMESMTLESQQDIAIRAQTGITIESQAQLSLRGQAGLAAESSAETAISGAIVKIN